MVRQCFRGRRNEEGRLTMSNIVQKLWGFGQPQHRADVAPTGSRLYRRLATGDCLLNCAPRRLPIGDTAGYQPALLDHADS